MESEKTELGTKSIQTEYPKIETYLKYCSDDPRVLKGIFKDNKIRFTQPWALNDPLEFNPSIKAEPDREISRYFEIDGVTLPSEELFYRVQIVESQINNYGILSLSRALDSFDMWSRYANGHKGFLLELKQDFDNHQCMKSSNGEKYVLEELTYTEDYSVNLDELFARYEGEIPFSELRRMLFLKKTSRWEHEKEYRLVRPLTDSAEYKPTEKHTSYRDDRIYLFDFSLDCIASVVFGASMSVSNKLLIQSCCKDRNIELYQSVVVRNQKDRFGLPGNVYYLSLNNPELISRFHSMQPQVFCSDVNEASGAELLKIERLSELPYYQGNEKFVDEFLEALRATGLRRANS